MSPKDGSINQSLFGFFPKQLQNNNTPLYPIVSTFHAWKENISNYVIVCSTLIAPLGGGIQPSTATPLLRRLLAINQTPQLVVVISKNITATATKIYSKIVLGFRSSRIKCCKIPNIT